MNLFAQAVLILCNDPIVDATHELSKDYGKEIKMKINNVLLVNDKIEHY